MALVFAWAGCGHDTGGPGEGDSGLADGGADVHLQDGRPWDSVVVSDGGRPDGAASCPLGQEIREPCLCGDELHDTGWCCSDGWSEVPCWPSDCDTYVVPVEVPEYDPANPEHFLVATEEDWTHVNDPDKRIFFVEPNAAHVSVTITASGSVDAPRILALHRPDRTHPARLSPDEQAKVHLVFDGAAYWIVDRLSSLDDEEHSAAVTVRPGSHDLVFNMLHVTGYDNAVRILGSSRASTHDITVQRCRFDTMRPEAIDHDSVAVFLNWSPWDEGGTLEDVHIVENEIRNANDGIQAIRHPDLPDGHPVNYPGLVIACNHIYVDTEVYTDGQGNPNPDPDAEWALTENAVDLKAGSDDPSNPVIVTGNVFWGFRRTDTNGGGSGSWGAAIVIHFYVKNLIVSGNLIFDTSRGIAIGAPRGLPHSAESVVVEDNVLSDIGRQRDSPGFAIFSYDAADVLVRRNTIVGGAFGSGTVWMATNERTIGLEVRCNAAVSCLAMRGARAPDAVVADNYHYDTPRVEDGDGPVFEDAAAAQLGDLVFWTDRYTPNPRRISVPGVQTTADSPHAGWCGLGR